MSIWIGAEGSGRNAEAMRKAMPPAVPGLFAEIGIHGVSLLNITRTAGATKSLIHDCFGSGAELRLEGAGRRHRHHMRKLRRYAALKLYTQGAEP